MQKRKKITPDTTKRVLELFYRTKLRPGEEFIDNRPIKIAEELREPISIVNAVITKSLNKKTKKDE